MPGGERARPSPIRDQSGVRSAESGVLRCAAMKIGGSVVVITGASSGIGRATAIAFAREGASVVLAARRREALGETARACEAHGARTLIVPTDIRDKEAAARLIGEATSQLGRVDILVNNAGYAIFDKIADAKLDDLESMMETNYFGMLHCTKAVLPQMIERRAGAIVNVASIAGIMGYAGMGGYCATKFAIIGLTEALRDEVLSQGISVSLVCPGTTSTDFFVTAEHGKMPAASRLILAIPPERVARKIVQAAKRGTPRIIVPFLASAYMKFKELMPRPAHFFMRHVSAMFEGKKS